MFQTGKYREYYFLQTNKKEYDFNRFVKEFGSFLIGKAVGVLSFYGDSLKPTKEEYQRGWTFENEVAYFKTLNAYELNSDIFANCYDEWYLFDEAKKLYLNEIFVTYGGFRLIDFQTPKLIKSVQNNFWEQVAENNPVSFILFGDNFIYGTKKENEIQEIQKVWK